MELWKRRYGNAGITDNLEDSGQMYKTGYMESNEYSGGCGGTFNNPLIHSDWK